MMTVTTAPTIAYLEPGEVVWSNVLHPFENRGSGGKFRPAVLLRPDHSGWQIMGLTSNSRYRDGSPRQQIADPAALGLRGPSWLWGSPTWISRIDVGDHIGWVDDATAHMLAAIPGVMSSVAELLGEPDDGPWEMTV